jgi:hypothetical protein
MTLTDKQQLLASHLATFRAWPYETLAKEILRTTKAHDCLNHVEGTWDDGTEWQIEVNVFWDDRKGGDVRVIADLTTFNPNSWWNVVPIQTSDAADDFIMAPDGTFVGE